MSRPAFAFGFLFFMTAGGVLVPADPDDDHAPKITPAEAQQYCDQHKAEWLGKITPGQERLFETEEQWKELLPHITSPSGTDVAMKKLLFDEADQICSAPMQPYHEPDPKVPQTLEEGWQRTFGDSLVVLAFAAKLEPHSKYEQRMHDMVLEACTFPTWGRMGQHGELANMDLAAGSICRGIAISYDWHRDAFTDAEKDSIRKTMAERVHALLLGLYGGIFWSNWYSQNHNHVAVSGMGLAGLAFLDEIPEAPLWLAGATLDFQRAVQSMANDGSSYEGVGYWGYGRAYIFTFIEGTKNVTGIDSLYDSPSLKNAAAFRIGSSTPDLKGILMWADARGFDVDGPHQLLYRLADQYKDGQAQYLADHLPFQPLGTDNSVWSLLWHNPEVPEVAPTALDYFFPDWDVVTTRSGWGAGDYLLSFKAGQVNDHHTHPDIGALTFYVGGDWLLMAAGYGLGMGQPGFFDQSGKRYTFFSNSTEAESTLLINGPNQRLDPAARGTIDHYIAAPHVMWTEADLTQAYQGVQSVRRRVLHRRGEYALVLDEVTAAQPATVDWLAQVPPRATHDGARILSPGGAGSLSIRLLGENAPFEPRTAVSPIHDVLPKRMTTLSSEKKGGDIHFAALLQPQFLNEAPAIWEATSTTRDGETHVSLKSGDRKDDVFARSTPGLLSLQGSTGETAQVTGSFLAVSRTGGKLASVVVGGATKAQLAPMAMQGSTSADFSLEQTPTSDFVFDLGTSFSGQFTLGNNLSLYKEDGTAVALIAGQNVTLDQGRYYFLRDAGSIAAARQWAAGLFPPRPDPRTYPLAQTPNLPPAPAEARVTWEAENAPMERYDYASVQPEPVASGGRALTGFGIHSSTDSVGWKIKVPASGGYFLKVRYSTTQPNIGFTLLIDGALPSAAAKKVRLTGIRGTPREKYFVPSDFNWKDDFLTAGDASIPLCIPLTAGEHEIRFADPTQPVNFDSFELTPATSSGNQP